MKTCNKCNTTKELTEFYKRSKDVYRHECKKCYCDRVKQNSLKHVEEKSAYDKEYRKKNSETIATRRRKWERENYQLKLEESKKEDPNLKITKKCSKCKEVTDNFKRNVGKKDGFNHHCRVCEGKTARAYEVANREAINERRRQWYEDNKEAINKRHQDRKKNDPVYRAVCNMRTYMGLILKGTAKCESQMKLLGCTRDHYLHHMEAQFTEGMSWDNYGEWHQDHIQPCASFDQTDPEQQKICWHYTNFQPLWAEDNLRKSDQIVAEFQVNLL
jgi:hypothetical protein